MKRRSLSIAPSSPRASVSSSREQSPSSSPRHGLLASHSPPLSPTLSQLDDYIDEKSAGKHHRKPCIPLNFALSILLVLSGTLLLINSFISDYKAGQSQIYDLKDQSHLPTEPSAIIVDDDNGQKKWTIWIPPQSEFPLRPWQYSEICAQSKHIQAELQGRHSMLADKATYYHTDEKYVQVSKAVSTGLLPGDVRSNASSSVFAASFSPQQECEKSMTFVMETEDAGMGNSLLALWLSYGLAKKEGRAFFLDDTRWIYGKYSTYFQLLPHQGCKPPSIHERVPCPRSAQHLVVTAATFKHTFGPEFADEFVDKSKPEKHQHYKINHLMEHGYKDLFRIADTADAVHVQNQTRGVLYDKVQEEGGMTIGVHVRHGDLHPWETEFQEDYFPATRYMNEVRNVLIKAYEHDEDEPSEHKESKSAESSNPVKLKQAFKALKTISLIKGDSEDNTSSGVMLDSYLSRRHAAPGFAASRVLLASDDPLVFKMPEMSRLVRAQDRIVLATSEDMKKMQEAENKDGVSVSDDDDAQGWEGGFYATTFLNMGASRKRGVKLSTKDRSVGYEVAREAHRRWVMNVHAATANDGGDREAAQHHEILPQPTAAMLEEREIVGRAYVLDLAVLGQSDVVVCAVSSAACRILGVMLGWDKVERGDWHNVDGKFGWQGLVVH